MKRAKNTSIQVDSDFAASNFTDINDYKLGRILGCGAYALVKVAVHKATRAKLAIKVYDKFKLNTETRRKSLIREV